MFGIENKVFVLKLNKFWEVVDTGIVGDALIDLAGGGRTALHSTLIII